MKKEELRDKDFDPFIDNKKKHTKEIALDDDEAHASALNETRYREFLDSYLEYERKYRK